MQSISAALQEEQKRQDQKYYRIVEIYKQYWTGSAYAWDTVVNISAWVAKVSIAKWKLDVRTFNHWKSPNFHVIVDNRRNEWSEIESTGIWKTGANQPYKPELSKIRVRVGQTLPDGTKEDKYVFTGIIHKPPRFHDIAKTATLECIGKDEILRRKSAEGLSTAITDELLGSDAGTEFTTANNGVGGIPPIVKKGATGAGPGAATTLKAGIDYTLSDKDKKNDPLKVTLAVALTAGNSVWCSYRYWYQDKTPSWVVEQLLILAGESNYRVDPTIFAVDVKNTWTQTTAADWNAGVHHETQTVGDDVKLKFFRELDNFEDGNYTANPVWTVQAGSWNVSGDILVAGSNGSRITTPCTEAYGWFGFQMQNIWTQKITNFSFISNGTGTDAAEVNGRYRIKVAWNGSTHIITLDKLKAGSWTTLITSAYPVGTAHVFAVYRDSTGKFTLYGDPYRAGKYPLGEATDNEWTTSNYIHVEAETTDGSRGFDEFWINTPPAGIANATFAFFAGKYVTQRLDAGISLTSWGLLEATVTDYGQNLVSWETITSTTSGYPGDNHADWIATSAIGQINSAVKRYLWARPTLLSDIGSTGSYPILHDLTVNYYTSSITIALVNFTGMNVLQAIQEVAKYPCYEIGYDIDEYFFYRQRTSTGPPVLIIDSKTNLEKEISFNWGTDRIKNVVDVTFGDYRTIIDPAAKGESSPHSVDKYGEQKYTVTGSTLLLDEGADVATATAETIYAYAKAPKKRAQVQMKFLLQYQLGDVAKYLREHKFGRWLWGDTDRQYCNTDDPDFVYYSDPDTNGWNINTRIEGIELDTEPKKMRMKLDLTEIL